VIWNNRSVWHSATGKLSQGDRRVMHLTAFNGDEPPRCNTR
jgi:alpha-ketoglutarate-dependent taurine dioxygenase